MQCMVRRAIVAGESSREAVIISLNETGWPMSQGINLPCHSCRWVNSSLPEGDLKSDLDRVLEC